MRKVTIYTHWPENELLVNKFFIYKSPLTSHSWFLRKIRIHHMNLGYVMKKSVFVLSLQRFSSFRTSNQMHI